MPPYTFLLNDSIGMISGKVIASYLIMSVLLPAQRSSIWSQPASYVQHTSLHIVSNSVGTVEEVDNSEATLVYGD